MKLVPVILCGGAGSRLWPVSREMHPKPFIRLHDGQSLLQKAFINALALPHISEIITITNEALFFKVQDEYQEVQQSSVKTTYILEPVARNTAPAIAAGALYLQKAYSEDVVMLILAADHFIQHPKAFGQAVQQAYQLARLEKLVTFGIQPDTAETGYGYLHIDKTQAFVSSDRQRGTLGYGISHFVEKPDLPLAQAYVDSGEYLWNAGLFCFQVSTVLRHMQQHCPKILAGVQRAMDASVMIQTENLTQCRLSPKAFEVVPTESFDYAVMEPASKTAINSLAVVPCDIGWRDVGSWQALWELAGSDEHGNCVQGQALLHQVRDCFVHSPDRMVGVVGVKELMIIDTADALLVADKHCAQEVKHLYLALKEKNHETYRLHRTVHRPWGTYTILEASTQYKIKRIEVNPQASLSLQIHHHRSEHWVVVSGMARIVNGERECLLHTNESTYIPAGQKHRLENPGVVKLVMIEVQSGEYLGEDDIVRFADDYGRTEPIKDPVA